MTTVEVMTPLLVRRRAVCDLDTPAGERPPPHTTSAPAVLRAGAPLLAPVASLHCFATDEPVVALTYDDGPDPERTPEVLDALAEYGVRATFFLLAERARRHPDVVARLVADGHEIGLHGDDHARLSALPAREAVRRVKAARAALEDVAGRPVALYRPAYGAQTLGMLVGTRALGLDVVLWSAWARDWEPGTPEQAAHRAAEGVHPGAVVLLHDASAEADPGERPDPARTTALLLDRLAEERWTAHPVGVLAARFRGVRSLTFERRPAAA